MSAQDRGAPEERPRVIGYQADSARRHTMYVLAVCLAVLSFFQAIPALMHLNPDTAPDWARLVLLISMIELAYAAWLATTPDWSTAWVVMQISAAVAALYAVALGAAVVTPRGRPVLLEMDEVRDAARLWCSAVVLLTFLLAYACGRTSVQWYRRYDLL